MTIAAKIVNDALVLLGVSSVINPPEPEQQSYAFDSLQGLIHELNADQIVAWAGYPNTINDDLGESPDTTESIKAVLAKRIAAYMQVDLPSQLVNMIYEAENRILSKHFEEEPILPSTLPIGAGNAAPYRRAFFAGKVCS